MAIKKVKSTTNDSAETIATMATMTNEAGPVESAETTNEAGPVESAETTNEAEVSNETTINHSHLISTMSVTKNMDIGEVTENKYSTFINRISSGLQTKDIILNVNHFKKLNMNNEDVKTALSEYKNDAGAFLEAKNIIPTGTGMIFNELQIGRTKVDALIKYAIYNEIDTENRKKMLTALSKSGLYGVLKAIQDGDITVPGPSEIA